MYFIVQKVAVIITFGISTMCGRAHLKLKVQPNGQDNYVQLAVSSSSFVNCFSRIDYKNTVGVLQYLTGYILYFLDQEYKHRWILESDEEKAMNNDEK